MQTTAIPANPTEATATAAPAATEADRLQWRALLSKYERPHTGHSLWQVTNSVIPYLALWGIMILTIQYSYLMTLPLTLLAAGFLIRIFIIAHDCGHGAFFRSPAANHLCGAVCSLLTFTPYRYWAREHGIHHSASGNLDRRGTGGDIWTMTVDEYRAASRLQRLRYRFYRNPLVMFGIGAFTVMIFVYRFTGGTSDTNSRRSVHMTNFAIGATIAAMCAWIGWQHLLMILIPTMLVSSSVGVWLFYVQHQFEGVQWARASDWDFMTHAVEGSSYYKLPRILQWFTGNIGFHHVHHLSPRIPNYRLERCHRENPLFQRARTVTLLESLKTLRLRLWDERARQLVGYDVLRRHRRAA